jgi:hypothetical protein
MTLLRDIQDNAVSEDTSVTVLLRQCLLLSARLQHQPLRVWAQRELDGYPDDAVLPPYRPKVQTQVRGNLSGPMGSTMNGQPLTKGGIPDRLAEYREALFTIEVRQGVAEIESLLASGKHEFAIPWSPDLVALVQGNFIEGMNLMSAYQVVPATVLSSTLSGIRDRVVQFALDIEAENPHAGEAEPGERPIAEGRVTQIFNQTVIGDHAAVAAGGRDVRQETVIDLTVIEETARGFGINEQEVTALLEAVRADGGEAGPETQRWLDRLREGAVAIGTSVSVQTAVAVLSALLGLG